MLGAMMMCDIHFKVVKMNTLIGSWALLHCKLVDVHGEELVDPFADAFGRIMYDAAGNMSAQIMKNGYEEIFSCPTQGANGQQIRQAYESYLAYYGKYTIDEVEKIVTHQVVGSLLPSMIGLEIFRKFEFHDADTIVLSNAKPEIFMTTTPITRYLTWQRI
jgi:hypothetical protein